ncbi:Zn-ribbon containing protein [Halobacteriales archaeon Cl-PHB]
MPHQCTDCGRAFDDGSKEMLSGCPDCGGNKFQFHPDGVEGEPDPAAEPPEPPESEMGVEGSVAKTVGNAATAVRDLVGSDPSPPEPDEPSSTESPSPTDSRPAPERPSAGSAAETDDVSHRPSKEDVAQASARSDIVSPDELPPTPETPKTQPKSRPSPVLDDADDDVTEARPPDGQERDRPDLSELRAELNDQFESIKVLEPGQYELNLMELYDREEYIIALQEDGKYTIQVPERWQDE